MCVDGDSVLCVVSARVGLCTNCGAHCLLLPGRSRSRPDLPLLHSFALSSAPFLRTPLITKHKQPNSTQPNPKPKKTDYEEDTGAHILTYQFGTQKEEKERVALALKRPDELQLTDDVLDLLEWYADPKKRKKSSAVEKSAFLRKQFQVCGSVGVCWWRDVLVGGGTGRACGLLFENKKQTGVESKQAARKRGGVLSGGHFVLFSFSQVMCVSAFATFLFRRRWRSHFYATSRLFTAAARPASTKARAARQHTATPTSAATHCSTRSSARSGWLVVEFEWLVDSLEGLQSASQQANPRLLPTAAVVTRCCCWCCDARAFAANCCSCLCCVSRQCSSFVLHGVPAAAAAQQQHQRHH